MSGAQAPPPGADIRGDIEDRPGRALQYRARVRWHDVSLGRRVSRSESFETRTEAENWIEKIQSLARSGVHPATATMTLLEYGQMVMPMALRGLEPKTTDPYLAGWRLRVVPTLGHLAPAMISNGAVDRAVYGWIAEEVSRSTVKNSLAVLVRVMEQAVRDGLIDRNPARVSGWQSEYRKAEDELDDPRSLALPDYPTLTRLADALVERSAGHYRGWGEVTILTACTGARIGEVSGCRVRDIDPTSWIWTVRRQTTPSPGGLADKGTKGKRARYVPLIEEVRELMQHRLDVLGDNPDARLFTGPRGGAITTAVLRDATHWDEVVRSLGLEHLRRHGLRHTGLTWMADAGVPLHVLRTIAGHGSITTTQRYFHPDRRSVTDAGTALSTYLRTPRSPAGPQRPAAPERGR